MAIKVVESSLNPLEQIFCDEYLHTGDVAHAFRVSGIKLDFGRSEQGQGGDLLQKQAVKDYILMLSNANADDMETCIARLEAVRREAWRRGDYKHSSSVEMEIAKLRGWLIERSEVKTQNIGGITALNNDALITLLNSSEGKRELKTQGLFLKDGRLQRISDVEYTEIEGGL